jgi:hypothetical protein
MRCCLCGRKNPADYTQEPDGSITCHRCEPMPEYCPGCDWPLLPDGTCSNGECSDAWQTPLDDATINHLRECAM